MLEQQQQHQLPKHLRLQPEILDYGFFHHLFVPVMLCLPLLFRTLQLLRMAAQGSSALLHLLEALK